MHIRQFVSTNVQLCMPESSLAKVGETMRRHQRECLAVVDDLKTKRVMGMITDRDIMLHLVHIDLPASEVQVKDCMTPVPTMISADAELDVAVRVMKKEGLYRLPIIEDGRLVGMLSLEDLALASRRQWAYVGSKINEQHITEILEAVAVTREHHRAKARR
jgi:CBS domain-containing protein